MTITKNQNGNLVTLYVEGRLDTSTSVDLEKEINAIADADQLIIDFEKLEYISSAGLRVLLAAYKAYSSKKGLSIINISETVMDVFDVTGFRDILNLS
ncbi:MAG: STAS domain-containing protein [Treponemataceae bacterium]|nr:STAS domain-containing protein [Treponemataceae bacterium]